MATNRARYESQELVRSRPMSPVSSPPATIQFRSLDLGRTKLIQRAGGAKGGPAFLVAVQVTASRGSVRFPFCVPADDRTYTFLQSLEFGVPVASPGSPRQLNGCATDVGARDRPRALRGRQRSFELQQGWRRSATMPPPELRSRPSGAGMSRAAGFRRARGVADGKMLLP